MATSGQSKRGNRDTGPIVARKSTCDGVGYHVSLLRRRSQVRPLPGALFGEFFVPIFYSVTILVLGRKRGKYRIFGSSESVLHKLEQEAQCTVITIIYGK